MKGPKAGVRSQETGARRALTPDTYHLTPVLRRGFTLIEAIATIAVLAVLGSIVSTILLTTSDGYLNAVTANQLHNEASTALDRMVREVRNIPLNSEGDGPNISAVTSTSITFNGNSGFTLAGSQLQYIENGATRILAEDVTDFTVQTFNESGAALPTTLSGAATPAVRRVTLTITISRSGVTHTLRSSAFVRSTIELSQGGAG